MRPIALAAAFIAASSLSGIAVARTLSPSEALERALCERAQKEVRQSVLSTASAVSAADYSVTPTYTVSEGDTPTIYVFTANAGRGFLCVSANDVSRIAVLGYSDSDAFTADDVPPAMSWWLDVTSQHIAAAGNGGDDTSVKTTAELEPLSVIEPIVPTVWGQTSPFNALTPTINGAHTPTGCVATALAQCMYVERWPEKGIGKSSYRWTYGSETETLALDFDTITFDWDNMALNYNLTTTASQQAEVAKLMYAVGVAFNMGYNPAGSGSNYMTAASALIEHFDYAESVCYYEREYFEYDVWRRMIHRELELGRPVPYSGVSSTEGHAFVVDGYRDDDYFHINWGWNGMNNGYFLLTELNPGDERSGDPDLGYNMGQAIITGLTRSSRYEEPAIELRVTGDFESSQQKVTRTDGRNVTFRGTNGIFSMAYATTKVNLGVKVESSSGEVTYVASETPHTFSHFSATQTYSVPASGFPTNGTYEVSPAYRDSAGVWHDILIPLANQRSISLKATSSTLVFGLSSETPNLVVDVLESTPIYIDRDCSVKATITNSGTEYYDEVWPILLRNDTIIAHGPGIDVNVFEGSTYDFEWVGSFKTLSNRTLWPGTYTLALADSDNGQYHSLGGDKEVEVRTASQAPLVYEADAVTIDGTPGETTSSVSPAPIYVTTVPMAFRLECRQGYFGQRVHAKIHQVSASNAEVLSTKGQFVGLGEGDSQTVTADVDLSDLHAGELYAVYPWASTTGQLSTTPAYFRIGTTALGIVEAERVVSMRVWTIDGREVTPHGTHEGNAGLGLLPAGFYIVETVDETGGRHTSRVFVR